MVRDVDGMYALFTRLANKGRSVIGIQFNSVHTESPWLLLCEFVSVMQVS